MSRYRTQVKEVINRNVVVSLALEQGFNAFLPVYDGGVDFILHHEGNNDTRKVQLKGRWMIDKKYERRDIWMAFPIGSNWYLMPHDEMVRLAAIDGITQTASWVESARTQGGILRRLSLRSVFNIASLRSPKSQHRPAPRMRPEPVARIALQRCGTVVDCPDPSRYPASP